MICCCGIFTLSPRCSPARIKPSRVRILLKSVNKKTVLVDGSAEREGFEPTMRFPHTCFQDRRLKPLGHLSQYANDFIMILKTQQEKVSLLNSKSSIFSNRCTPLRKYPQKFSDPPSRSRIPHRSGNFFGRRASVRSMRRHDWLFSLPLPPEFQMQ